MSEVCVTFHSVSRDVWDMDERQCAMQALCKCACARIVLCVEQERQDGAEKKQKRHNTTSTQPATVTQR